MSYYHRKDPVAKHVDLLLSCGCTVTADYDPDKESCYEFGEQRYCRKHKKIETIQSVEPWDEMIIS